MLLGFDGCDDILSEFVKFYYFNFGFSFGIFPDSCKIAKIVPINKSGSKLEMGKYRPISIWHVFQKY